ncbi:Gfo/Idh/MocA family oxidoreductase [Thermoanaerobacterium sp. RBIITD]|uniref:Gfo/Idh/MocA family protein n=1 Tax=Thermoanaerobacterium TaxID=28895 RepID=UPI000BB845D8|nr:Gfo/Idh/MocA family oxidoreductase [Thermoanaerobacterium sp. RBIITD]WHE05982.1 Gfo/Idh/MocA family oxidoreductase [Thermoanaerobacterium thermosaccharolyticum]SNX54649.1 Predicted dehydrogenase [Thermoanaerobacterium sp. RBIITD]
MNIARIGLIGISGFGSIHLRSINFLEGKKVNLKAITEVNYEKNKDIINKLSLNGVKYFKDYRQMLNDMKNLDFVVISTPIHFHAQMAIDAIKEGFNVLLEKPPAVTIQDINAIIEAKRNYNKICAVDFQNTSGTAFRKLIEYIKSGKLGKIKTIIGVGCWKRDDSYYQRNNWAGKLVINNNYVLDGSINNPLAHLLNNELIIAESSEKGGGEPKEVISELYHGHKIEGEDTACVKIVTTKGIEVYYYSTLCNKREELPYIIVEAEKANVYWNYDNKFRIKYFDGNEEVYDGGKEDLFVKIYENMIEHLFKGKELYCPVEITRNFVLASNGAFESSKEIFDIPDEFIEVNIEDGKKFTYIKNIREIIEYASENKKLFSEMNVNWGRKTEKVNMKNYEKFDLFKK